MKSNPFLKLRNIKNAPGKSRSLIVLLIAVSILDGTLSAMNDPHIFIRGLGQASGDVVIAETGSKAVSPITTPIKSAIKKTAINTGTKMLARVGETTAGKAVSRIATETVEQMGTKLSSAVEKVGQFKNSFKESVGEAWQKIKGERREPKKLTPQHNTGSISSILTRSEQTKSSKPNSRMKAKDFIIRMLSVRSRHFHKPRP